MNWLNTITNSGKAGALAAAAAGSLENKMED